MRLGKPAVFLACSGLGRINRGYESFARECFDTLKEAEDFDLFLIKGGGKNAEKEIAVCNIHRQHKVAHWLGRVLKKDAYFVEQLSFCIAMLPLLIKKKPALVYFSDFILGTFLWHLRRFLKFKYKLLFSNGAPNGPPFIRTDHIQQLLPLYIEAAKAGKTPDGKQTLIPYAIKFSAHENIKQFSDKSQIRKQLKLPADKKIIISVGAVNSYHKRMDYVVMEFAMLDPEKYFLIILGHIDEAGKSIIALAREKLKQDSYIIAQAQTEEVANYLFAADYFILASLQEGLPRVLPEALSTGLLPIVHDYDVTRQTLGKYGIFKNLLNQNSLQYALNDVDSSYIKAEELIKYAWEKYSWDNLKADYINIIRKNL